MSPCLVPLANKTLNKRGLLLNERLLALKGEKIFYKGVYF